MKEIKGDAIQVFKATPASALIHQVNCRGVMGSGIAKQIKKEFPSHHQDYLKVKQSLGGFVATQLGSKFVIGVFGQESYGRDGARYTNYAALSIGLSDVVQGLVRCSQSPHKPVLIVPKYLGCDRGGGNWEFVEQLLVDFEAMYPVNFIVVEYEEGG